MSPGVNVVLEGEVETAPMLGSLADHAIPGIERFDAGSRRHTRLIETTKGLRAVTLAVEDRRVTLSFDESHRGQTDELVRLTRRRLDLDTDLEAVRSHLGEDPVIGPLIAARPSLRVLKSPEGFEAVIMTVLGQQVSLARSRTFGGRIAEAYGSEGPAGLAVFPDPERLAETSTEVLRQVVGITGARAHTIRSVAGAYRDGFELNPDGDIEGQRARLREIPGIGPWTVEYLGVRVLDDPDAFPSGDLVLRRALDGIPATEAEAMSADWKPWRAYALNHLWTDTMWPG